MKFVFFLIFIITVPSLANVYENMTDYGVDSAIVQQKIQPATNKVQGNMIANETVIALSKNADFREPQSLSGKVAQNIENNRGLYCNLDILIDRLKDRLDKSCSIQDAWERCKSSDEEVNRLFKTSANTITSKATGVLNTLYTTRDLINDSLTAAIDANKGCSNILQATLLSDGCLNSIPIILNESALSDTEQHCTPEQVSRFKTNIEGLLFETTVAFKQVQDLHIESRKREYPIYNLIVKIEESIAQVETNNRTPANGASQIPENGN